MKTTICIYKFMCLALFPVELIHNELPGHDLLIKLTTFELEMIRLFCLVHKTLDNILSYFM